MGQEWKGAEPFFGRWGVQSTEWVRTADEGMGDYGTSSKASRRCTRFGLVPRIKAKDY